MFLRLIQLACISLIGLLLFRIFKRAGMKKTISLLLLLFLPLVLLLWYSSQEFVEQFILWW